MQLLIRFVFANSYQSVEFDRAFLEIPIEMQVSIRFFGGNLFHLNRNSNKILESHEEPTLDECN